MWSAQHESLRFEQRENILPTSSRNHKCKISQALQIGSRQVVDPCGCSVLTALLIHQPRAWVRVGSAVCELGVICFQHLVSFIGAIPGAEL